ncbi:hypothetical protein LTS18_006749, partial [Coniosporium uncinatum]
FLQDGEWTGYYCYASPMFGQGTPFDPPMVGVRFDVTDVAHDSNQYGLHSDGQDACGKFKLEGRLFRDSGVLALRKTYTPGPTWHWAALMTPFGIVGSWGQASWGVGNGWVWLWKREWCGEE